MWVSALLVLAFVNTILAVPVLDQKSSQHQGRSNAQTSLREPWNIEGLHSLSSVESKLIAEEGSWPQSRGVRRLLKRAPQSSSLVAVLGSVNNALMSLIRKKPQSSVPDLQSQPSKRYEGAVYNKVRYGPYRVPPVSERNVESNMLGVSGMTNTIEINGAKPCKDDCILLSMQAGLEFADGTEVPTAVNGASLHHTVVINRGVRVWDATCGRNSEYLFESGAEQTLIPLILPESGIKAGYHLRKEDKFAINSEFMNLEDKEKWVWLTLKFDLIPRFDPEYKEAKLVWVSVGPDRCTGGDENPFGTTNLTTAQQPTQNKFEEYSNPWISPKDGHIIGSNSHLHNGGLDTELYVNGTNVCNSTAKYSKTTDGRGHKHAKRQMMGGASGSRRPDEQLTSQEQCAFPQPVPIAKGQPMYIKTHYDLDMHPGMLNSKGELDEVMAIAGVLMVFEYEQ